MARKPRNESEGGLHHVYARGVDRQLIFRDDVDRLTYLTLLGCVAEKARWRCLAYCLMENHVHLLLESPEANLGRGMQRLHGSYATAFNARHGRVGHVFQGRFGAKTLASDVQLWATVAYIARNPVEAGLCDKPERWRWSSYGAVLGGRAPNWLDVSGLLSFFAGSGNDPLSRYVELVSDPAVGTEGTDP